MQKMKLQVEDLQVDSFATNESGTHGGTVGAHQVEEPFGTDATCPPVNTCNQTNCGGYTCEWTKCAADTCKPEEEVEFPAFGI